jgi:hypothetical protein
MSFLVASMILIAIDITVPAAGAGPAAVAAVLVAAVALLAALTLPLLSVRKSINGLADEVKQTLELGSQSSAPPSTS